MQKFIIKLFVFLIPFVILYNLPKATHYIFNTELISKINTFTDDVNEPMIIVGGDSRAERQIIPKIMEERLGIKTINIAVSAGDVFILYNGLKKNNLADQEDILIISVSSWQINNNTVDLWGIPHTNITHMSFIDDIEIFGVEYLQILHSRLKNTLCELFGISSNMTLTQSDKRTSTNGFLGIEGKINKAFIDTFDIDMDHQHLDWYHGSKHNGIRKIVFENTLKKIAELGLSTIIYQPPFAPCWVERTKDTYIDSLESDFSLLLKNISDQYINMYYINYYLDQDNNFQDEMFYNFNHCNAIGAEIFTNSIIDSILYKNLI